MMKYIFTGIGGIVFGLIQCRFLNAALVKKVIRGFASAAVFMVIWLLILVLLTLWDILTPVVFTVCSTVAMISYVISTYFRNVRR